MGNLKKKRRLKMNKHKRRKRLKANRHKKRTWQKWARGSARDFPPRRPSGRRGFVFRAGQGFV